MVALRMKRAIPLLLAAFAFGQNTEPKFDVASIHPTVPGSRGDLRIEIGHGQVVLANLPMHMIFREAYGQGSWGISAGDYRRWMLNQYVIQAKADPATKTSDLRLMLQALLKDRFQMRSHFEQQTETGFLRSAPPLGLKVTPVAAGDSVEAPHFIGKEFRAENATLDEVAAAISARVYRPIENKTGIAGRFTFSVPFPTDVSLQGAGIKGPGEILDPISKALGMRFSEGNVNVRALVIDHLEAPSEN